MRRKPMVMKKFINKPEDVARELTLGMVKAYSNYLTLVENDIIIRKGVYRVRPGDRP
jgi:dihydroxyacetone kinase